MNTFCQFDESDFPLVRIKFLIKDPTLAQFNNELLQRTKNILARKQKYVVLMDARILGFLSSEIRIAQGTFFKEYKKELSDWCMGAVILVNSPIVKMMIRAMMVISKPPNLTYISSKEDEALRLAKGIINNEKVTVTDENMV